MPATDIDAQWAAERRRLTGWASAQQADLSRRAVAPAPRRAPQGRVPIDLTPPPRRRPVARPAPASLPVLPVVPDRPTGPPVAEPPVAEPRVTEPPVTEPPVTEPPVTEPPVTEPPVTEPPVTEPLVPDEPVGLDLLLGPADATEPGAATVAPSRDHPAQDRPPRDRPPRDRSPRDRSPREMTPTPTVPPAAPVSTATLPRRRPGRGLVVAAAVVTLAAVGTVGYATTHTDTSRSAAGSSATRAPGAAPPSAAASSDATPSTAASASARARNVTAAVTWARANLTNTVRLLADAPTAQRLTDAGFTRAQTTSAGSPDWVVSDATTRAVPDYAPVLAASVPVARFGTGADAVEVNSVLEVAPDRVPVVLAADLANRKLAGSALATNPQIRTSASTRALLQAGGLNLRAETFLALLSADTTVRVLAIGQDAAEAAAGRPRRTLTLAVGTAAVRSVVASLPTPYAPRSVVSKAGTVVLTWSSSARPVQPVS